MNKLFDSIKEGSDPRNRVVFICKDANGLYVYKPTSGFKSRHYTLEEAFELQDCFDRQCACGHAHAFYNDGERPAKGEKYPLPKKEKPVKDDAGATGQEGNENEKQQ